MKKILMCSAGALSLSIGTAALAQEATGVSAQSDPASRAEASGIDDIIVTAQRRGESVQHTALSIQALSSEVLTRAAVTKSEDLSKLAPGVQVGSGGPFPQTYIRGVGNYSVQVFAEGAVAYNLDGVYISRPWATRGIFFDLDRVEILKGPQGTLYGRNASGGAINIITEKPKIGDFGGYAQLEGGSFSAVRGEGAINLPLNDRMAFRLSGQVTRHDGYLSDGYDDDKTQAARAQLLVQASDDVSVLLHAGYQYVGGKGAGAVLSPQIPGDRWRSVSDPAVLSILRADPAVGQLLVLPNSDGYIDTTVYSVGAELNWDLGGATLTVLPAYRYGEFHSRQYTAGFFIDNQNFDKQTSVEVRLGNSTDNLKWVLGGYFFDESQGPLAGQSSLTVLQGLASSLQPAIDLTTKSYAAFGQATLSITDALRVTAGIRYTKERKHNLEQTDAYFLPDQTGTCTVGVFDPTAPFPPTFCHVSVPINTRLSFSNVSYKAGIEYDVTPNSMAYVNFSTGFKSGGVYTAPAPNTFKPEKLVAFDAGLKSRFLDNRLQLNMEVFYWSYKDHQESFVGETSLPGYIAFQTLNAGKAKSYGADLDVTFQPDPANQLSFKVQYNRTNYDSFAFPVFGLVVSGCAVGAVVDCSGKPLVRAPLWSGVASYTHTFDLGKSGSLEANVNATFASGVYLSTDFLQSARQEAYILGDIDLTYRPQDGPWSFTAFVRNVGNTPVAAQAFRQPFVFPSNPQLGPDGAILSTLRPPRTYGVRVRYNF